ncbi:MAG: HAD-IIB family hydrolase [Hyphomicrobiales bacterium]
MGIIYLFDVDGTLTPARQPMDDSFRTFFLQLCGQAQVYLITGSDRPKLDEQVPPNVRASVEGIFTCAGCQFWKAEDLIFERTHEFDPKLVQALEGFVASSPFDGRFGNHMEFRTGMINVSVPGRNVSKEGRQRYYEWDKQQGERQAFIKTLNDQFPDYSVSAGGQISIDVSPLGWTKAQILKHLKNWHPKAKFIFFGDRMNEGGNDRPLALALEVDSPQHRSVSVDGPQNTLIALKDLFTPTSE